MLLLVTGFVSAMEQMPSLNHATEGALDFLTFSCDKQNV